MGREIRLVPPHWDHPNRDTNKFPYREGRQPMFAQRFDERFAEWLADFDRIRAGDLKDYEHDCYPRGLADWLNDEGQPPDPAYYQPFTDAEATWFQLWETVSEGTPVSPPFATKEELADYLAANGDEWDQKRCREPASCKLFGLTPGKSGWGKDAAYKFVMGGGWAPSMVVSDGKIMSGVEFITTTEPDNAHGP